MQYSSVYSLNSKLGRYSSVPNRCAGQNKRAGGKILKKTLNMQDRIDVQWVFFYSIMYSQVSIK